MVVSYKEQMKNHTLPYEVKTKEELESDWLDNPETVKVITELQELDAHTSTASTSNGTVMREAKMPTIKEEAQNYVPQTTKNIADLPEVNIETMQLQDREGKDNEGTAFKYKVIVVDGEEFRVPGSVIGSIKGILEKKADLKRISVSKTGAGMQTRYTVIPLE